MSSTPSANQVRSSRKILGPKASRPRLDAQGFQASPGRDFDSDSFSVRQLDIIFRVIVDLFLSKRYHVMQPQWRMNNLMVQSALTFVPPKSHGHASIATCGRSGAMRGKWESPVQDANAAIRQGLVSWLMLHIDVSQGTSISESPILNFDIGLISREKLRKVQETKAISGRSSKSDLSCRHKLA